MSITVMRKALICFITLALLLVGIPFQNASAKGGSPPQISDSAAASILMDQDSGRVLYGKNIHQKRRIASITKVMTAILAIESGKLNKTVTISSNAYGTEGSSLYLKKGEKIKLKDLVYGLMLRSGNDAAVAIAEAVGGSVQGFTTLMNKKAKELGMMDTNFSNPHGLDNTEDHYSSAYDMAILTSYAMKNPTFQTIFKTKYYTAPNPGEKWDRKWKNKNKLLFQYDYSTGGKTGYTTLARRTLISTASKDGENLIVVTLNDGNDWQDHMNLFNWGFTYFQPTTIVKKGKITGIDDPFYQNHLFARRDLTIPLTAEEKENLKTDLTLKTPPKEDERDVSPSTPVGHLTVTAGDKTLATLPLFYQAKEKKPSFWSDLFNFIHNLFGAASHD
ncbi:D-alanyl-D-alanine carboxypeptidase [Pullulanibacillus sp. KACC 23026]|uniref:D-alanyl-D-alanine carboxypeptidase family protein n=1 Tax=Pullulanibacillus sp. KACC 23026 TaxID=3028315 RepID=UPI0023B1D9F4|nr:D-alanyl-D-alanine carboxypeptidase family protein [Pullulanibacillus sp. KACC 23026]WEG11423.1 D-alanyl-D-alanine carboxypeptidase [Pullulanibacillus sp. KACC 23026]